MNNNENEEIGASAGDMREKILNWISISIPLSISFTCMYEYSYMNQLHISLSKISITISDITMGVIYWLPTTLFIIYVAILYLDVRSIVPKPPSASFFAKKRYILVVICLILWAAVGEAAVPLLTVSTTFAFLDIVDTISRRDYVKSLLGQHSPGYIAALLYALALVNTLGTFSAVISKNTMHESFYDKYYLSTGDEIEGKTVRSYERGYIIISDRVYYISRDNVSRIDIGKRPRNVVGLPCYYFNIMCF